MKLFEIAVSGLACIFPAVATATTFTASTTSTTNDCDFDSIVPSPDLHWHPCGPDFSCAKLKVPLDHQNQTQGYAAIPLLKSAATPNSPGGPYQGMLMIIPGGPGGSGVDLLRSEAAILRTVVGSNWDIVSYDPRGMFRSEPALDCALNASSTSVNVPRRDAAPRVSDSYYRSFLDYGSQLGEHCAGQSEKTNNKAGMYMSTAVNARDLVSVVDAYARSPESSTAAKNASLLHFYAFSYGTVVAQTFASMFPSRVGNAVLDGTLDPEKYQAGWIDESINHLDGALASFFVYCSKAGPSLCPYATGNSSAQELLTRFKSSLSQLDARHAEANHWPNASVLASALLTLKSTALNAAYTPQTLFPPFAQTLLNLSLALSSSSPSNLEDWIQSTQSSTGSPSPAALPNFEFVLGVACTDQRNLYSGRTLEGFRPQIESLESQSVVGELWIRNPLGCAGWRIKPRDVFTGRYGGRTATPMLFVSNTFDPVTPVENSHSQSPKYENAQIVTVDGAGHTSEATLNRCAFAKIRAYLQTSRLPGRDNFCAAENTPFGVRLNGTLGENIRMANLEGLLKL